MEQLKGFTCFKCQGELNPEFVGRRELCPKCTSDVRVCLNCTFFDPAAYNQFLETQAQPVVEKDRANFCSYFRPRMGGSASAGPTKDDLLKSLDDLFKKQ